MRQNQNKYGVMLLQSALDNKKLYKLIWPCHDTLTELQTRAIIFNYFFFSYIYQYCIFKGRSLRFIILGCHCFVITHVSDVILLSSCEFSLSKLLSDSLGGYKIYAFDLLIKQRYRMPSLYPLL